MLTDPTGLDPELLDLLVEWELRQAAGTAVTPEEVCRDCPERVDDLRRQVARMARLDPLLAVGGKAAPPTVPGFALDSEIGRGGMGVVYKARDLALDRVVALKIPSRVGGGPLKRFEREGRALAKLRHPSIVSVHSAAVSGDTPFLAMEYVPGGNLAERAKEVAGSPARAAALVAQVARAVAHAHAAGIVHRDLKPSNILIDEAGRPLVTDFGVAALLAGESVTGAADDTPDDRDAIHTRVTRTAGVAGTPAYSAPEVYDPVRFGSVGPATDVWALGVILYELLTGRRPFAGRTWDELREQVCAKPHAPAAVGRRWRRVIDRCLAKVPAARFRSANELADALTATGRWRWWVAGGLAVSAAVGGAFAAWPRPEPPAAVWPDVPSVRDSLDKLVRGEAVELIAPDRPPAAFDWASGPGSGRVISAPDESFRVVSQSPAGCLVEFLPALPPGRYRIDADLLHETGNGMSWVGVYAAASHCQIARGRQHFVLLARYSDRGDTVAVGPGNDVSSNRRTHLQAQYLGDTDRDPVAWYASDSAPHPNGRLVPPPPVGWRQVSLTLDPTAVAAAQAAAPVGGMTFEQAMQTFADARKAFPDLPAAGWGVSPFGGVGVYVTSGSVVVRSFRVTPLPPGE